MTFDKIYLFDTFVAARQYYQADDVWRSLEVGSGLAMKAEPGNPVDSFAVSLWAEFGGKGYKIGYLPRTDNEVVAAMLAMGWEDAFDCVISRLDGSAPYERQIGITIRVLRRKEADTNPHS